MTTKERTLYGDISEAYAADPSKSDIYEFRYKVVELDDLIASHDANLQPNDKYPQELQPRLRDRAASKTQVENIARNLNTRALLHDTGFIDTGPMIVGSDNVVESGNGRVLGLRKAADDYPQRYRLYKTMLENQADKYGLKESDIDGMRQPVLVRERITDVDRVEFARAANVGAVMGMSPYEQASTDAKKLKSEIISQLQVGEEQTIDQALRMKSNDHIVKHFVSVIPENERATIADAKGSVNLQGMNRLKLALFTKTYTGESGQRLARIFGESADPQIKSIENAMFQSLPDMAKAESLISSGDRDNDLSIAPDLAEVVDTYAGIKTSGITVKDYLAQQAMFEERLNPIQRDLLNHLDDIARRPKQMREFIRETAQSIIDAPPKGQTSMMGFEPLTKESLVYGIINRQRKEKGLEPITPTARTATSKGLEKPDTGGTQSTERMAGEVGAGDKEDTRSSQPVMMSGSVQVGLAGMGKDTAQVKMLEEFGTAPGQGGSKQTLIDVEAEKAKQAAKPLPGQIDFMTGKTVEGQEVPPVKVKKRLPENFALAARNMADSGSLKVNQYEWNVSGDDVTVGHSVTGRIYGTIDLKTGNILPTKSGDDKVLDLVFNEIAKESYKTTDKMKLDNLLKYPGRNKAEIETIIKKYPEFKPEEYYYEEKSKFQPVQSKSTPEKLEKPGQMTDQELKTEADALYAKSEAERLRLVKSGAEISQPVFLSADESNRMSDLYNELHRRQQKEALPAIERIEKRKQLHRQALDKLREIHSARSPQSQAMDNAQLHSKVISHTSPSVNRWIRDQGTADVQGIDTPSGSRITEKPVIEKKKSRISGRNRRITPKIPKLR